MFLSLTEWINRLLQELLTAGKLIKSSDSKELIDFVHETIEFVTTSLDINMLSLEVQKSAD